MTVLSNFLEVPTPGTFPAFLLKPHVTSGEPVVDIDQRIITRLDELIQLGEQVLKTTTHHTGASAGMQAVDSQLASQWITSCRSIVSRVFGIDSPHCKGLSGRMLLVSNVNVSLGVLRAAKDDYENGHLLELRRLVEAEVIEDLLEQAEHLLDAGYWAPGAVVCGCVLEDALRRLCQAKAVPLPSKPKLDQMNADLAKAGVYNKLMQKRITALADIRNCAAHSKWNEFSKEDVEAMIRDTRAFLEKHFC